jgi:hypothetical protein
VKDGQKCEEEEEEEEEESHIIFSIIYTLTYNNEPVPLCFISIIYILYTHVSNGPL